MISQEIMEIAKIGAERNNLVEVMQSELAKGVQSPLPVRHHFLPGIYMREMTIPAGTCLVGHYHKYPHVSMLTKGTISVFNPDGTTTKLTAPQTMASPAGKKCAYAHDEVIWVNVHPTLCQDVDALERELLDLSQGLPYKKPLLLPEVLDDQKDYIDFTHEISMEENDIRSIVATDNLIPLPFGAYKFKVTESQRNGLGIFCTSPIQSDEMIGPVLLDECRTVLGRFTNHSKNPNAKMIDYNGNIYMVATRVIDGMHGGDVGEEITVDYRQALEVSGRMICQQR